MVDILHRVGMHDVAPAAVYDALTTLDGLSNWWTRDTTGDPGAGGVVRFRFPAGGFDMEVLEAKPAERVTWRVVDGPPEWIGTTIDWTLRREDDWTVVLFAHRDWRDPVEFMHHCSTKWATFLLSLKSWTEEGHARPAPDDLKPDNY